MGTVLAWLIAASVAVVMWLLLLWTEHAHDDRQERKAKEAGRPAPPPRRR